MDNVIVIENLNYTIDNKKILNNISFVINKGQFVSIVGPSGSGKSILVRAILGLIPFTGRASVCNMRVNENNLMEIRKKVGIVFENPDNQFVSDSVEDELAFTLENMSYAPSTIRKKINEIADYLDIKHLLNKPVNYLSGGEKQLVALASVLLTTPKILILDEAFVMLDGVNHHKLLNLIRKIHQEKKITIINVTHDMNDTIYSDRIIVMNNGQIVLNDKKDAVYEQEKILKRVGLSLPFMVDLSKRLSYYGLTNKVYLNMSQMVEYLWK